MPEELGEIATPEIVSNIVAEVESYVDRGYRLEGESQLLAVHATSIEMTSAEDALVSLTGCLDTSENRVVDGAGDPVTGGDVEVRVVTFEIRWRGGAGTVFATEFPEDGAVSCAP
ncbi:hypothetical protein GCM10009846_26580 [Agrococcus versicolor]|uniref:Halobacterial output domain-containing protein n=1 Tax=Agrococcus versicolor TaxID=501482 RepID=A0ABN3AWH9_9MICO